MCLGFVLSMWFCPPPNLFCTQDLEVYIVLDIWGLLRQRRDYWLETRVKARSVQRVGRKTKVFVFLTSFLEVEGWYPPLLCPRSTFPFGIIDFAGIRPEQKGEKPWAVLRALAPKGTRFDYHFFFVGIVIWAHLGCFVIFVEHSGV